MTNKIVTLWFPISCAEGPVMNFCVALLETVYSLSLSLFLIVYASFLNVSLAPLDPVSHILAKAVRQSTLVDREWQKGLA